VQLYARQQDARQHCLEPLCRLLLSEDQMPRHACSAFVSAWLGAVARASTARIRVRAGALASLEQHFMACRRGDVRRAVNYALCTQVCA